MLNHDYHRPRTLNDALALKAGTSGARFVAGGTDLLVQVKSGLLRPPALVSLRSVPELSGIEMGEPTRIGAACTLNEVMEHAGIARRFGVLVDALRRMGSTQVRNAATLGGNLCNASPAADSAPPLLVLGARVRLEGPDGARELPLDRFLLGPGKTALGPDEILTHVVLDSAPEGARAVFLRKERVHIDIAIASMAVLLQIEPDGRTCGLARVAAGAVAPVPTRLGDVEALLEGAEITDEVVARARSLAASSVAPISDLRASASYRRHLVGVLLERAIEAALSEGSR